jgi:hypothetical protein
LFDRKYKDAHQSGSVVKDTVLATWYICSKNLEGNKYARTIPPPVENSSITPKTSSENRAAAVAFAIRHGLA